MLTRFTTQLILSQGDAEALGRMLGDFSAQCEHDGIWARARSDIVPGDAGLASIAIEIVIDDDTYRSKPGRVPKELPLTTDDMKSLMECGMTADQVAEKAGISRATLFRRIAQARIKNVHHVY